MPITPSPLPARLSRRTVLRAAGLAAALGAGRAFAQRPVLIQFSHVVAEDTAKGQAALRFKELAQARSGGRVRVEVHPDSTLYKDREELEALRLGAVQMLAPSLSKLSALGVPEFEAFDLPYLFRDHAAFRAVTSGRIGAGLLRRLEPLGVEGLAYWDNGFKVFTANRALRSPDDVRGLKVRVQASRTLVEQMRLLGAEVSVSPLADVHEALRSGRLDGQENVPSNIDTQRLHEAQSHLAVTRHGYLAYAVIVNQAFWRGLDASLRALLLSALQDATAHANRIAEQLNAQALARIAASGRVQVVEPGPAEQARWRRAMLPLHAKAQAWIDPALIDAMQRAGAAPG
ncbi:DctP family TRAP transporter solute-binding subunit [Ramlibacter rhizophilus]|uniref:DctP family TRAP transporter solute-binding subunit n=1 Tax=Ramlibacter rhizophilus TaxID=1781167 RepID=A0A4Z0BZQ3_9BURK|nr:DctP family TRAP transporter solute-binding subunit [Ramlibacter rhizophilus]TFZ03475.1 DctP family TRAP transporter solute-binding subunit [Ramlibacter rhizophilus]